MDSVERFFGTWCGLDRLLGLCVDSLNAQVVAIVVALINPFLFCGLGFFLGFVVIVYAADLQNKLAQFWLLYGLFVRPN